MDLLGALFAKIEWRGLRKGKGRREAIFVQKDLTTKEILDQFTVMPMVSADGVAYKPLIVYPGTLAHYRKVQNQVQSLNSVLSPCYVFQRNPVGVDSDIMYQWAIGFFEETTKLRKSRNNLLRFSDGYGFHVQYQTIKMLEGNRVFVVAQPAHTSHVTQLLDVSVFNSYKSYL